MIVIAAGVAKKGEYVVERELNKAIPHPARL
jgi:hypothetical protein